MAGHREAEPAIITGVSGETMVRRRACTLPAGGCPPDKRLEIMLSERNK
jgi:hypothetical protein